MDERSELQLRAAAEFYGITMEEARRRHTVLLEQKDNPDDPICIGCARRPFEISDYTYALMDSEEDTPPTVEEVKEYVVQEEGTFNRANGHFLCDECYIKNGMPSSDRGWVCP